MLMYFAVLIETIDYLGNKLPEALQLHYPNYQIGKRLLVYSVTRKKSPNVYKTPLQKILKNVRDLGKLSVAKSI